MDKKDIFSQVREALPQRRELSNEELTPIELLARYRVTPSTILPPMGTLFKVDDIPCFYRGELVAVCGKAKSGKTLFLSMIMACCLTDRILALERVSDDGKPLRVLWLDTEQSQQSTQEIMLERIIPMAGDFSDFDECFYTYNLRGLGYETRRDLMEVAINTLHPDIVIIDGIKDLVTDINDAIQATQIMEQLMALAQKNNCCIVNVLHQNKSEADHNMRGSIGTELTNKAFEVYTCEFIEESDTFKVTQRLSRRMRIKRKMFYQLNSDGLPVECAACQEKPRDILGRWVSSQQTTANSPQSFNERFIIHSDNDSYEWNLDLLFEDAFDGLNARTFSQLMAIAMRISHIQNKGLYYTLFRKAEQSGILLSVKNPETGETWVERKGEKDGLYINNN